MTMNTPQKYIHDADETTVDTALTTESSSTTSTAIKHKLRFSLEPDQVFHIIHINDMNLKYRRRAWYSKGEQKKIKQEMRSDIRIMNRGDEFTESNTQSARGLERQTRQAVLHRQNNKIMAREAVLNEQQRQLLEGERDDELVADAYHRASVHCRVEAYLMGLNDEAAIKEEVKNMSGDHTSRNTVDRKINSRGNNGLLMRARLPGFRIVRTSCEL